MKELSLGIVGLSPGNGHPYSWSAIFNGYDPKHMAACPFPVIPKYLSERSFPEDAIDGATVTHIYTQDPAVSRQIQKASRIPHAVSSIEELTNLVDAVLLARDDAENHFKMSLPIIEAGLPVFIDKPLAYTVDEARNIFKAKRYANQIFSCSSFRYAEEFLLKNVPLNEIGAIQHVQAVIQKDWKKYAVHLIEPVLGLIPERGMLDEVINTGTPSRALTTVKWSSGITAQFNVLGNIPSPITITLYGEKSSTKLLFRDTFSAFKRSLQVFVESVRSGVMPIPEAETLEIVDIIEQGTL